MIAARPTARGHAHLEWLGSAITDHPWRVVLAWIVVLVLAYSTKLIYGPVTDADTQSALGPEQPYSQAQTFARHAFPDLYASADAVLVYARDGGLTEDDLGFIRQTVERLQHPPQETIIFPSAGNGAKAKSTTAPAVPWKIRSHFQTPYLTPRFLATDNKTGRPLACLVLVSYDLPYNTEASFTQVNKIESAARAELEKHPGLTFELTGTAGLGRDRQKARAEDHERIRFVTVLAVLVVLLIVYRAPLAASIPLLTIGVSAIVATKILRVLASYGAPISGTELTYLVVIVFGSGTDYALFWMSRYREELAAGRSGQPGAEKSARSLPDHPDYRLAARQAYVTTMPGILSSAGTTIFGLAALVISLFEPMRVTGMLLAFALAISLAASLSLMPALGVLLGRWLFWPQIIKKNRADRPRFWRWASLWVTKHPRQVLLVIALLLAGPLYVSYHVKYRFDITGETHADSSFERGRMLAEKYFDPSILFPWTLLIQLPEPSPPGGLQAPGQPASYATNTLRRLSEQVSAALQTAGAKNIWSYAHPLGRNGALSLLGGLADEKALANYYNPAERALRWEVMGSAYPFSDQAITQFKTSLENIRIWLTTENLRTQIYAAGPTAYMANVQAVADVDEPRVRIAVVLAVGLAVVLLVRNLPLTIMLLGITLMAYYATLGLVQLVFVNLLGRSGVDWEIKIFSFVILMAIGQDYNIFLVSRLIEERRQRALKPAVRHALVRTAGIISNCGLITAVSLGSLSTSGLQYLQQMGFALACGALLDTYLIRPFLLPAFLVLWPRPRKEKPVISAT